MRISDWSSDVCSSDLIRETLEECGLVLGLRNGPDADLACQIRERMKQGESFAALLGEYGLELDLAQFVPFARWLPNVRPRNYDTRFYLARLPVDSHAPCVDATENVRLFWASARDVLDRSEEHPSELPSLMRLSYAVFCLKKKI